MNAVQVVMMDAVGAPCWAHLINQSRLLSGLHVAQQADAEDSDNTHRYHHNPAILAGAEVICWLCWDTVL